MNMFTRTAATVATLATLAMPLSAIAQGKTKTIKVKLHNATTSTMSVKTGTEPMTIAAGETRDVKVPAGTSITRTTDGQDTVAAQVTDTMNGATINLR